MLLHLNDKRVGSGKFGREGTPQHFPIKAWRLLPSTQIAFMHASDKSPAAWKTGA